jgi:hypothetical protein
MRSGRYSGKRRTNSRKASGYALVALTEALDPGVRGPERPTSEACWAALE